MDDEAPAAAPAAAEAPAPPAIAQGALTRTLEAMKHPGASTNTLGQLRNASLTASSFF